jgi:hypothetical protein
MPWPDAMMPIAPNYVAAERAILECAWAGCETIWVVCNQDISRVLKNKIGEFVYDPVRSYFEHKTPEGFNTVMFKKIPIYYVPILQNKRYKTSLPFSVIFIFILKVLSNEKKGGSCLVSFDRYWFNLHFRNIFSLF